MPIMSGIVIVDTLNIHGMYQLVTMRGNTPRIQHSPASMGNGVGGSTGVIFYPVIPDQDAGTAASASRLNSDRDNTVSAGSKVHSITVDITTQATGNGPMEVLVFKAERQDTVPVIGTFPIPSNAAVLADGAQQSFRMNMPGWVMRFHVWPTANQTPTIRKVRIPLRRFRKSSMRDGDYVGVYVFNRTTNTVEVDFQARYYEYK